MDWVASRYPPGGTCEGVWLGMPGLWWGLVTQLFSPVLPVCVCVHESS